MSVQNVQIIVPTHLPGTSGLWPVGTKVRYRIGSLPANRPAINLSTMSQIMSDAFNAWKSSGHLPIDFVEVTAEPCEIVVNWERFAGIGLDGILARTDDPPAAGTSPNVIAFNDDPAISWAASSVNGFDYDLRYIALHEVGHAIGLAHSTSHEVVMSDSIGLGPGFGLQVADITAAGLLYAHRVKNALAGRLLQLLGVRAGARRVLCGSVAAGAAALALQAAPQRLVGGQAGSR